MKRTLAVLTVTVSLLPLSACGSGTGAEESAETDPGRFDHMLGVIDALDQAEKTNSEANHVLENADRAKNVDDLAADLNTALGWDERSDYVVDTFKVDPVKFSGRFCFRSNRGVYLSSGTGPVVMLGDGGCSYEREDAEVVLRISPGRGEDFVVLEGASLVTEDDRAASGPADE